MTKQHSHCYKVPVLQNIILNVNDVNQNKEIRHLLPPCTKNAAIKNREKAQLKMGSMAWFEF